MKRNLVKGLFGEALWSDFRAVRNASRSAMRALTVRWRGRRLSRVRGQDLLLNLGCGTTCQPGWINVDSDPPLGCYFADFRDSLELPDGCAAHVHCEHVLEHLERYDAERFLRECRRVLTNGGTLRLVVPDAEKYMRAYVSGDSAFFDDLKGIGNPSVPLKFPVAVVNQMFRMGGAHRYAWDFSELSAVLDACGFANVERSSFGQVDRRLDIDGREHWRARESLYVSASARP